MPTPFYGTAAAYREYGGERGWDAILFPADDDDVNAALLVASEYLDQRYRQNFSGVKTGGRNQIREWPRTGAYVIESNNVNSLPGYRTGNVVYDPIPDDEIPREVITATFEIAKRQIANPGALRTDFTLAKSYKQVSIEGAISVSFAGANSASDAQLTIAGLDSMIAPLLGSSGSASPLNGKLARV